MKWVCASNFEPQTKQRVNDRTSNLKPQTQNFKRAAGMGSHRVAAAVLICFLLEAGALGFLRGSLGIYGAPLAYLGAAAAGVWFSLQWLKGRPLPEPRSSASLLPGLLPMLLLAGAYLALRPVLGQYKVDPAQSDIIPLIEVLVRRFLQHQPVYDPVTYFGYTIYPNYFPLTWLPFVPAEMLGVDYRLWAFLLFAGACCWLHLRLPLRSRQRGLAVAVVPVLFILFLRAQPPALGWAVEPLVAAFYLLLALALFVGRERGLVAALVLCLLSRYAVVALLPALALLWWKEEGAGALWKRALLIALGLLLLFAIPFLLVQPASLMAGYKYYTAGALAEWRGQSWQAPGSLPFQLSQGYGLAIYFYRFVPGELEERLQLLQKAHLACSFILPLLFTWWYLRRGRSWLSPRLFSLLLLKLFLVVFFLFIQVPYAYLYLTPLLVSGLVTALVLFSGDKEKRLPEPAAF